MRIVLINSIQVLKYSIPMIAMLVLDTDSILFVMRLVIRRLFASLSNTYFCIFHLLVKERAW